MILIEMFVRIIALIMLCTPVFIGTHSLKRYPISKN